MELENVMNKAVLYIMYVTSFSVFHTEVIVSIFVTYGLYEPREGVIIEWPYSRQYHDLVIVIIAMAYILGLPWVTHLNAVELRE